MNVRDKIKQSIKRPRLRRRVKKDELWDRNQRLEMAKLADQFVNERKNNGQQQT